MLDHKLIVIGLLTILVFATGDASSFQPTTDHIISPDASIKGGDLLAYNISAIEYTIGVSGKTSTVIIGDGKISTFWGDVPETPVLPFGADHGSIKSAYGNEYVYFLITHDYDMPWVALEWDTDGNIDPEAITDDQITPMEDGDDMWVFGNTSTTSFFGDLSAKGQLPPFLEQDTQNDLEWEMILLNTTDGSSYFAWEFRRALNTNDIEGSDVIFSVDKNVTLILASEKEHRPDSKIEVFKYSLSDLLPGGATNITITPPVTNSTDNSGEIISSFVLQGLGWGVLSTVVTVVPAAFIIKKEEN